MSGFVVMYHAGGMKKNSHLFDVAMERLAHRGPDGSDTILFENVSMGHCHFWTTPEEVGERQPLTINDLSSYIVFDGRIDNREDLIAELGGKADLSRVSDAELVLQAYSQWGKPCFRRFVGEFALVIFDHKKNELVCARDQLGERTLFYQADASVFVVASEPWAVLGALGRVPELNLNTAANYFTSTVPANGQTFFEQLYELLPSHMMTFDGKDCEATRYWKPDAHKKIRYATDEEYAREFLALLKESVRCRMRSSTPVGVMMSGGLDSTSIACLAAQMLAPETLTTISNVYDELPDCDERKYINAVREKWNLRSLQVPSDDTWTFKDWARLSHNANHPEAMLYRASFERDYMLAQKEGIRVLFMGEAGDPLYLAGREWLVDLVKEGRWLDALRGLVIHIKKRGLSSYFIDHHLRPLVRTFLARFSPWVLELRRRKVEHPAWLTNLGVQHFERSRPWLDPEMERYDMIFGLRLARHCSQENANASHCNIEVRFPYRDRRLVEFVAAIPAYLLYYGFLYKHILRIAMRDILPDVVRERARPTFLTALFDRGFERETQVMEKFLLSHGNHAWARFVNLDWVRKNLKETSFKDRFIVWLCVGFETWHTQVFIANHSE